MQNSARSVEIEVQRDGEGQVPLREMGKQVRGDPGRARGGQYQPQVDEGVGAVVAEQHAQAQGRERHDAVLENDADDDDERFFK